MTTIHIMLDLETWGKEPGCDIRSIGACVFDPLAIGGTRLPFPGESTDQNGRYHFGKNHIGAIFYIACDNPTPPPIALAMAVPGLMLCVINGESWYWDGVDAYRKYPLSRDPSTVQWWSEQSAEAQAAFADPVDLREALCRFTIWLNGICSPTSVPPSHGHANLALYAHGPVFDVSILAAAYKAVNLPVPWHYRAPRDTRTAFDMAGVGDHSAFMAQFNHGTAHNALDDAIGQARAVCEAYRLVQGRDIAGVMTHTDERHETTAQRYVQVTLANMTEKPSVDEWLNKLE